MVGLHNSTTSSPLGAIGPVIIMSNIARPTRPGSFSEILKISQIFGPTLTIYRYFIALIHIVCISVVRTYTILTGIYVYLLFD